MNTSLAINPGLKYFWPDYVYRHLNQAGVLEEDIVPKPDGEYRIMLVGDSYVAGAGVKGSQRIASQLEEKLNSKSDPVIRVKCYTFGRCGYNTVQQAAMIEEFVEQVSPDLLILGYVFNDAEDRTVMSQVKASKACQILNRVFLKEDGSYLWYRIFTVRSQFAGQQDFYAHIYDDDFIGWKKNVAAFKQIRTELEKRSIPFSVVVFPIFCQSLADSKDSSYEMAHEKVLKLLNELGIKYIDFEAYFSENHYNLDDLAISKYDAHPNAKAHSIMADVICEDMLSHDYIKTYNKGVPFDVQE